MAVLSRELSPKIFLLILLWAAVLRFYGLDRLGLWADELWVVMDSSQGSFLDMLRTVHERDNHPPGYYILIRFAQYFFGNSDFAIRFPSAVAGILLVAATFITGRKHLSPEAALIAATLVAGSYQAVYFSQEARPNIFVALFSLFLLHYFRALVIEKDRTLKNFMGFWLCATCNAYFHYVGLVVVFSTFVIYLACSILNPDKSFLTVGIKLFLPVLLLFSPWIPGMYHDLVASGPEYWQRAPTLSTLLNTFTYLFGPGEFRLYGYGAVFILTPLWVMVVLFKKPEDKWMKDMFSLLLLLWIAIVLPVMFFYLKSTYSQSAYNHRHFLYAIPLLALLTGAALTRALSFLPEKMRSGSFLLLLCLIVIGQWYLNSSYALYRANHFKQDYRESAQWITQEVFAVGNTSSHIIHPVITNNRFFDHYLDYFSEGRLKSSFILENADQIKNWRIQLRESNETTFYYLEAPAIVAANKMVTDMDQQLASHYAPFCRKKFLRTQIIGFEVRNLTSLNTPDWENLPVCTQ